jgi:hypothetical protein
VDGDGNRVATADHERRERKKCTVTAGESGVHQNDKKQKLEVRRNCRGIKKETRKRRKVFGQ